MGLTSSRGKWPARLHSSMMGISLSSMNFRVVSRTRRSSSVSKESNSRKSTPRNLIAIRFSFLFLRREHKQGRREWKPLKVTKGDRSVKSARGSRSQLGEWMWFSFGHPEPAIGVVPSKLVASPVRHLARIFAYAFSRVEQMPARSFGPQGLRTLPLGSRFYNLFAGYQHVFGRLHLSLKVVALM